MRIFGSKRRASAVIGSGVVMGLVLGAVVHAAVTFGPSRPTFTWANPASYITFNSITDNPVWGDERQLLKARDASAASSTDATTTQVKDGEDVLLTAYFHNNAATYLNLVATGTTVRFALPTASATTVTPTAYITANNANPNQVWATSDLTSSQPFTITYEPGSAKLYTNYVSGLSLSDNVVNGGDQVGSYGTDGKVPGCAQYSGYVTILVKVHVTPQQQPVYSCDALNVTSEGNRSYDYSVNATAKNGATITGYTFDFGDGSSVNTSGNTTSHTYAKDGTYTTTATVQFNVGSSQKSASCSHEITVSTPPVTPPPTTPPTTPTRTPKPTSLPQTGPGDVLGIFTGVSSLGAVGHYVVNRRRRG